jgi:Xaa-Pro aminopeptidase
MKKKLLAGIAIAVFVLCMGGCDDTGYNMLLRADQTEATTLKNYCDQNNFKSADISSADSLVSLANVRQQASEKEDAFAAFDLAIIYYRLALSKIELAKIEKVVENARQKLSDDEEQLNTYKKVLDELKGGK